MLPSDLSQASDTDLILSLHELMLQLESNELNDIALQISGELRDRALHHLLSMEPGNPETAQ